MSSIFTSFDDFYNKTSGADETKLQKSYDTATSSSPAGLSPIAETGQDPTGGQQQSSTTSAFAPTTSTPTSGLSNKASSANISVGNFTPQVSDTYKSLFKPLSQKLEQGGQKLKETTNTFTEAAGPFRSYEGINARNTLQSALNAKPTDTANYNQAISGAKGLVGSKYTGPMNLDTSAMASVGGMAGELGTASKMLNKPVGTQELIKQATPGLTPGQLAVETRRTLKDPGYQAASRDYASQSARLYSDYLRSQEEAKSIGEQRTAQETDI
jgi:hypothetical protein